MVMRGNGIGDMLSFSLCIASLPLSLSLWLINVIFSSFWKNEYEESNIVGPMRWLFSTLAPILLMIMALRRGSVNMSGALLGVLFAFTISVASHPFFASLIAFFMSSSAATKYGSSEKKLFENDYKEGEGHRNWANVFCNGLVPTILSFLYLIDCGSGERLIDFTNDYRGSWLSLAILSAFAGSCGDTWASELGTVLTKSAPFLITTWERVPRGTNGGITIIGLIVSFLGGTFVSIAFYIVLWCTYEATLQQSYLPQWPIIIVGGFAGLLCSIIDSLLGATLQYSGEDKEGKIVDRPGQGVKHLAGRNFTNNHGVNFISNILTAMIVPSLAINYWPIT